MSFSQYTWKKIPASLVRSKSFTLGEKSDNLSYSWATWQLVISGRNLWYICIQTSCMSTGTAHHISLKNHIFDFVIGQVPSGISAMPVGSHVNQHIPKLLDWSYSKANSNLPGWMPAFEKAFLSLICSLSLIACTGSWNWCSEGFTKTPVLAQI